MLPIILGFCILFGQAIAAESLVAATIGQSGEAFLVDVVADIPVPASMAWEVMTDFDHMAAFLGNLGSSRIVRRDGPRLVVHQTGTAHIGLFSYAFESEREIHLEPPKRIHSRNLSGSVKHMESEAVIEAAPHGTHVRYHAEVVPDSVLARMFGASVIRQEIEAQFREMITEMIRRSRPRPVPGS